MAEFDKESPEYKMFADYYSLTKRWYGGVKDRQEYDIFASELNAFNEKYTKDKCGILTRKLALALNNYVDELYYAYKETMRH